MEAEAKDGDDGLSRPLREEADSHGRVATAQLMALGLDRSPEAQAALGEVARRVIAERYLGDVNFFCSRLLRALNVNQDFKFEEQTRELACAIARLMKLEELRAEKAVSGPDPPEQVVPAAAEKSTTDQERANA